MPATYGAIVGGSFEKPPPASQNLSTDNAASSIVILSLGNPSAAGTRRRQALQECPLVLASNANANARTFWTIRITPDPGKHRALNSVKANVA